MAQRLQLAQETRKRFLAELGRAMVELGAAARQRLTELMNEAAPSREMQSRRDAWTLYQSRQAAWVEATLTAWQTSLSPPAAVPQRVAGSDLELLGTEVVEDKIIASRLVMSVMEKVSAEFNDLSVRIKLLEGTPDLQDHDIFRPEVLLLLMIEQWAVVGMPRDTWSLVNEVARTLLTQRLNQAYANANALLIKQGVLPTIELKDRVRRIAQAPSRTGPPSRPAPVAARSAPESAASRGSLPPSDYDTADGSERGSERGGGSASGPGVPAGPAGRSVAAGQSGHEGHAGQPSGFFGNAAEETRMMTSITPMARARTRAQGVLGQLKRFLLGSGTAGFEATHYEAPSPALAAAMALRAPQMDFYSTSGTALDMDSPAAVARVAGELRQRTTDLKNKAETKSEKAIIEIVALMFQAILQEERIPPGIRVWFARLQMPVLRLALAEPDFFGTLNHPARQLIDRMGSCVMGFDASGISGSALETEIKRVVQVVEQYPETGRRVYQLVYDEFQKFLAKFLTGRGSAQKAVSVAQQVEQKETLTIQYTIEMRNMLKDMPVRVEIREFLFKVWAEVLAVAAVRKGPQHDDTLAFKKTTTDLLWSASAKPNRNDRARVIADLPQLLQKLRAGMTLLGVAPSEQQRHIQTISDTLADAFLSKTQAIGSEQIAAMAAHLAHLENFVTDDGLGDLPLDAQSIEMMLGIDATTIDVVADGGSQPSAAMLAWAQELQVGTWFTLDHNGKMAQVQFAWRSERKHLHLFASTTGHSYLMQTGRLGAYLQAGLLLPQEEETLTVRATRDALGKLEANPERLLG